MGTPPAKCRYSNRHEILHIISSGLISLSPSPLGLGGVSSGLQHLFSEVLEDHSGEELRWRFLKGKARNQNFLL